MKNIRTAGADMTCITHHMSKICKKNFIEVNSGWTFVFKKYTQRDIKLAIDLGYSPYSWLYNDGELQRRDVVVNLR